MKSFSAFLFSCMIAISLPAQTFTPLVKFNGTNGDYPIGYLIQGTDGNIYGTTDGGGTNGNYGTIFRLTPQGRLTTAYSFCSLANCVDGEYPEAGLTLASDGTFMEALPTEEIPLAGLPTGAAPFSGLLREAS